MKKYIWLIFVVVMCAGGPFNLLKILAIVSIPLYLFSQFAYWFATKTEIGIRWNNLPYAPSPDTVYYEQWKKEVEKEIEDLREEKRLAPRKKHLLKIIRRARRKRKKDHTR